jgi:Spx/MgsR family transcriptional regulator
LSRAFPCLYGLASCDKTRLARAWLAANAIETRFHDYRREGISPERVRAWVSEFGWERLLNRSGTTYRKLDTEIRETLDEGSAARLMVEQPSLMRRPILDLGERRVLGFSNDVYSRELARS